MAGPTSGTPADVVRDPNPFVGVGPPETERDAVDVHRLERQEVAPAAVTAGSVTNEFPTLFAWNVGVFLIAVGANTLRPVNTPLGYT